MGMALFGSIGRWLEGEESMSTRDLTVGRRWVELQFEEIAREFGAPRALTQEDRWREDQTPLQKDNQSMAYYIEIGGRLIRGQVTFLDVDLRTAGTGEGGARQRLRHHIRDVLASSSRREERVGRSVRREEGA
jgi:hypothetical protein